MATQQYADALKALDRIETIVSTQKSKADFCKTYATIKPLLTVALTLIEKIPVYGPKIAAAIRFLMAMADQLCAA